MLKVILPLLILVPAWCISQKPMVFKRNAVKIDSVLIIPPVTRIYSISKGNKLENDKPLSREIFNTTTTLLNKFFPAGITSSFLSSGNECQLNLDNFVVAVSREIRSEKNAKKYTVPDSILVLFDTVNTKYVYSIFNAGFIRSRENLMKTSLEGEIAGVLPGWGFRPYESSALMIGMLINLEQKTIQHFERITWPDNNPADTKTLRIQLASMLSHTFD